MEQTDKAATENSEQENQKEKDKIGFEGWMFYLFLLMAGLIVPVASYIVMLSIA